MSALLSWRRNTSQMQNFKANGEQLAAASLAGPSRGWSRLGGVMFGWVAGASFVSLFTHGPLPIYQQDLATISLLAQADGAPVLRLQDSMQLILIPESTPPVPPEFCAFVDDGRTLKPWSVRYQRSGTGTLYISPLGMDPPGQPTQRVSVLLVLGRRSWLAPCSPWSAAALSTLEDTTPSALRSSLRVALGWYTLRQTLDDAQPQSASATHDSR